jgi:hypothetical protein
MSTFDNPAWWLGGLGLLAVVFLLGFCWVVGGALWKAMMM